MSVDAEVGGSTANSYVTVAEADAYFEAAYGKDAWIDADPYDKDGLVVLASRTLDQYMTWTGEKASEDQSMEWPRTGTPYTGIPSRLKDAVYELAYHILGNEGISFASQTLDAVKIGPIQVDFASNSVDAGIPSFIESMIESFGSPKLVSGRAPSSARVIRT